LNTPQLDLILLLLKSFADLAVCYVIWSLYRRIKIVEKEEKLKKSS